MLNKKTFRLSPVAIALLTASATLSVADTALGQTSETDLSRHSPTQLRFGATGHLDESLAAFWTETLTAFETDWLAEGDRWADLPLAVDELDWRAAEGRELAARLDAEEPAWTLAAATPVVAGPEPVTAPAIAPLGLAATPAESAVPIAPVPPQLSQSEPDLEEFETLDFNPSEPSPLDADAAVPAPLDLSQSEPETLEFETLDFGDPPAEPEVESPEPLELDPANEAEPTDRDAPIDLDPTDRETPGEDFGQELPPPPPPTLEGDDLPTAPPDEPEPRVLVAEVVVEGDGLTPELEEIVYNAITTRPGRTTTRAQLQEDVNAIFATGFFANVTQVPEDTPLGVRITFAVQPNPILDRVVISTQPAGSETEIPAAVVDEIFSDLYGDTLNLREFQDRVLRLNEWYQEQGYDLAQVVGSPNVAPDGTVTLQVAEGVIEDVRVRYLNEDGDEVDGRTRPFIITREMRLAPGMVFRRETAQNDLQRIFGLGLFEDARLSFSPGENPSQVVVNVEVEEGRTGSVAAGAGISSASGLFGTVSFQQQNLGGNNQSIAAEVQVGTRDLLVDLSFTDPWIGGDPYRTSYTVNAFRRRTISLIFDRGEPEVRLPNGDRPRLLRNGGGITFTRPLDPDPLARSDWTLTAGFQYQGISIRDADGDLAPRDSLGNLLSVTPNGQDILTTLEFGALYDKRDDRLQPTEGSALRVGMDQTLPIGAGQIVFNRLRASYSYYIPVDWINFTEDEDAPQTLAFNVQGGTVFGTLPPYEAFSLGGANSVRGYGEGDVGAGRSYLQATAEYRFPVLPFLTGAFFLDYATDIGTGDDVPGNPAGIRNKPGSGFGYGVGVRVRSPVGPIRVDFGLNDRGESRIHFGIGERF